MAVFVGKLPNAQLVPPKMAGFFRPLDTTRARDANRTEFLASYQTRPHQRGVTIDGGEVAMAFGNG